MFILIVFAFVAGVVTILSPCILPVLPVVLSASVDTQNKNKPFGTIIGFIASFTFFTLFLTAIVRVFSIPANVLRLLSVAVIAGFGLSLIIPKFQAIFENMFSKMSSKAPNTATKEGFVGGFFIGISLGLLWTPCVGPILASVISLALIGEVTFSAFLITLAYAIGTAIPMFFIMLGGRTALQKIPGLTNNLGKIQKGFGYLMLFTALAIFMQWDRQFQTYILDKFPNYGTGLTKIEEAGFIEKELDGLFDSENTSESKSDITTRNLLEKKFKAPELVYGGKWFNSDPMLLKDFRGKVVLIDFWTYSCINCQRTLPYLRTWWEKYEDDGLVIIGVHAPEFEFEKDPDNVQEAITDFDLKYPVMQDNNFRTWRAYNNRYWPAKYLIDKDGYVRYTHFGEGEYDETEKAIQQLLLELDGENDLETSISNPEYSVYSRTPETYLGYSRMNSLASKENILRNKVQTYSNPKRIPNNKFAFNGEVLISEEYSNPKSGSTLTINFDSQKVFLVMRAKEGSSQVKVYLDDEIQFTGKDVDEDGVVTITKDTLYELVDLASPGRHLLRIEFMDDNTEIYAFTFG